MPESLDSLRHDIRRSGMRATPARIATLDLMRRTLSPQTHAQVARQLAALGIDQATAFRNLNDLTDAGLLRRTALGDHVWRFEPVGDGETGADGHPHFLCVDCGAVSCLGDVRLTAGSLKKSRQIGKVTEILLRGYCNTCSGD